MKLWWKQTFFTKIKNKMILSKGRGVRLNSSDSNSNLSEITTSTLFMKSKRKLCILVLSTKITNYFPSQRLPVYQEYHPGLVTEFYLPGQNGVKQSRKTRRVKPGEMVEKNKTNFTCLWIWFVTKVNPTGLNLLVWVK